MEEIRLHNHEYPGVTTITNIYRKDRIDRWQRSECDLKNGICGFDACKAKAEEYANFGKAVHKTLEGWFKTGYVDGLNLEYAPHAVAADIYLVIPSLRPTNLYVEEHFEGRLFHGYPDLIGTIETPWKETGRSPKLLPSFKTVIIDYKIKNTLDILTPLQGYGYRELVKEKLGYFIDWLVIVQADRTRKTKPKVKFFYLPDYKDQWDATWTMYKFLNGME